VRALWDLWEQGRVPLLQGPQELQGQAQVPLIEIYSIKSFSLSKAHGRLMEWPLDQKILTIVNIPLIYIAAII
jgi:hypothetical protein